MTTTTQMIVKNTRANSAINGSAPPSEPVADATHAGRMVEIPARNMAIDRSYQRQERLKPSRVRQLAKHWDWRLYRPVTVCQYTDGGDVYYVVDGQHRVGAARERFGDDVVIPSYHIGRIAPKDAALVFAKSDENQTRLGAAIRSFALLTAEDPDEQDMHAMLARYGWQITAGNSASEHTIACVGAIKRIHRERSGGPQRLEQTIRVLTAAWGHTPAAVNHYCVGGLARLLRDYGAQVKEDHLVKRLAEEPPESVTGIDVARIAVKLGTTNKGESYLPVSLWMRDLYNRGLRDKNRLS